MSNARILSDRYRLDRLLAHGGMADVHRATDLRLRRPVAVKVLREPADRARFDAEVHTLAGLRHPNLVALLDAGRDGDCRYLVMELRPEPTLATLLRDGPLAAERAATVTGGLAHALAHVHERGVVHRDVKPDNVFVGEGDHVRLGDFGIARTADASSFTATGFTVGTAAYLAPEQLEGGELTPAVDVYALGLVVIECLSGHAAFRGTVAEVTSARLVRDPDLPDAVPARWRALVGAMTTRDPALRPSAARVAFELRTAAAASAPTRTLPVAMPPPAARMSPRSRPRLRRNVVAVAGLAVATFVGVAVVVGATGGSGPTTTSTSSVTTVASTTTPTIAAVTAPVDTVPTTVTSSPSRSAPEHRPTHRHGGRDHGDG